MLAELATALTGHNTSACAATASMLLLGTSQFPVLTTLRRRTAPDAHLPGAHLRRRIRVPHKRTFTYQLDLEGPGVDGAPDRLLEALTRLASTTENEPTDAPCLEIRDASTSTTVLEWNGA
ncbi:hypothetical protein G3I24_11995 [Micromonospora aurantiaca]|nr:hypothetical protein [Micromonospora aurantiaca]